MFYFAVFSQTILCTYSVYSTSEDLSLRAKYIRNGKLYNSRLAFSCEQMSLSLLKAASTFEGIDPTSVISHELLKTNMRAALHEIHMFMPDLQNVTHTKARVAKMIQKIPGMYSQLLGIEVRRIIARKLVSQTYMARFMRFRHMTNDIRESIVLDTAGSGLSDMILCARGLLAVKESLLDMIFSPSHDILYDTGEIERCCENLCKRLWLYEDITEFLLNETSGFRKDMLEMVSLSGLVEKASFPKKGSGNLTNSYIFKHFAVECLEELKSMKADNSGMNSMDVYRDIAARTIGHVEHELGGVKCVNCYMYHFLAGAHDLIVEISSEKCDYETVLFISRMNLTQILIKLGRLHLSIAHMRFLVGILELLSRYIDVTPNLHSLILELFRYMTSAQRQQKSLLGNYNDTVLGLVSSGYAIKHDTSY